MNTMTAEMVQTRFVLAGAYRGKDRVELTHLVRVETGNAICRKALNMCDEYGSTPEQLRTRPTCPACAKRWDKINGAT